MVMITPDTQPGEGPGRWTNEFLDRMRHHTDPETDGIVQKYFASFPDEKAGIAALFKLKKTYVDLWDAPMPADLPDGFRSFFQTPVRYPDWVDPSRIDVASDLFLAYGPVSLVTLLLNSAPLFWTNPAGAHAFYVAGIFSPSSVERRLKLLPQFILNFTTRGQLAQTVTTWPLRNDPNLPPGLSITKGRGVITVQKLRMAHAIHRIVLTRKYPSPECNWDHEAFGEPINQEDLAQATMHFCFSTIDGLARLGIEQTIDEQQGTFMAWKTVAFLLGLCDEMMPVDLADGRLLLATSYQRHAKVTNEAKALIQQELHVINALVPRIYRSLPGALMRYLMGEEAAGMLGVPDPKFTLWLFRAFKRVWKDHHLFLWIAEAVSPTILRWLDEHRRMTSQLTIK